MTHTNIIKQLLTFPVCWRWRGGCCRKLGDRLPGRCWTPQPVASSALASWLGSLDTVMAISSCCSRVSVLVVSLSASVPCAASSASPTAARDSSGVFTVLRRVYSSCTNFLMTAFDGWATRHASSRDSRLPSIPGRDVVAVCTMVYSSHWTAVCCIRHSCPLPLNRCSAFPAKQHEPRTTALQCTQRDK